jgi:hypothetical protein
VLIGCRGTHEPGPERLVWSDLADGEVIDGLGETWLVKAAELLGGFDPGELDDRSPELADQAQRDLLARALIEQAQPPSAIGIDCRSRSRIDCGGWAGRSP